VFYLKNISTNQVSNHVKKIFSKIVECRKYTYVRIESSQYIIYDEYSALTVYRYGKTSTQQNVRLTTCSVQLNIFENQINLIIFNGFIYNTDFLRVETSRYGSIYCIVFVWLYGVAALVPICISLHFLFPSITAVCIYNTQL